jgi:MSHA pilin protein MshD
MSIERRQRGLTLIELIMFIVIVGAALAGVLTILTYTTRHSADPLIRKQALAIAEAILEEAMIQPFTWCDPDDANAATAMGTADCAATVEALGAEGLEVRGGAPLSFDNVSDYDGLSTTKNIAEGGAALYAATVAVAAEALNGVPAADSLRITVTVAAPGGENIVLQGYRTRYAPNLLP